jgi:hypothetical protein
MSNKIDIEKLRLQNLKEIETKTTSLSDEILILKEQLLLKQAEKVRLEDCKNENNRVGKYVMCDLFFNK